MSASKAHVRLAPRNLLSYHAVAKKDYSYFDPSGGKASASPVAEGRLGGHFLSKHEVAANGENYSVYVPPGGRTYENYSSSNEEEEEPNYSVYVPSPSSSRHENHSSLNEEEEEPNYSVYVPPPSKAHTKKKGGGKNKQSRRNRRRSRRNRQSRRN